MKSSYFFFSLCLSTLLIDAQQSSSVSKPSGEALCLEHMGYTDKPIMPIIISDSRAADEICNKDAEERTEVQPLWSNRLSKARMVSLLEMAGNIHTDVVGAPKAFGTFAVVTVTHQTKQIVIIDKIAMIEFLVKLKTYCTGDERFCRQINNAKNRLSP